MWQPCFSSFNYADRVYEHQIPPFMLPPLTCSLAANQLSHASSRRLKPPQRRERNPPAPKAQRRGDLAEKGTNRSGKGGGHVRLGDVVLRSAQPSPDASFRPHISTTSAQLGSTLANKAPIGPNPDVRPNVRSNVPKLRHVGTCSWTVGPKLARARPNLRPRTAKFDPSLSLVGIYWAQAVLVAKRRLKKRTRGGNPNHLGLCINMPYQYVVS